jgi:hypothetical protein
MLGQASWSKEKNMAGHLIPPPELSPEVSPHATLPQRVAMWRDLVDTCEQFLLAGLRRKIGPDGDLRAAYRQWYSQQMEEHDRKLVQMGRRLSRPGDGHAG